MMPPASPVRCPHTTPLQDAALNGGMSTRTFSEEGAVLGVSGRGSPRVACLPPAEDSSTAYTAAVEECKQQLQKMRCAVFHKTAT